jgi:hypothetical protein
MKKLLCLLPVCALWACHDLTPKQATRLDRFQCQAEALAPAVEPALDATELLKDLYAGKANLGAVLSALAISQAELNALLMRLQACDTDLELDEPQPAPEPAKLRASW